MDYDIKKSGKRIKDLRERKGLKQEMVSADLGISLDGYKRIKRGSNGARIDTLVNVTKIGRR
ncbi:MAG: helix-turn-helix domain-containing protein [Lachnotalea sp.]